MGRVVREEATTTRSYVRFGNTGYEGCVVAHPRQGEGSNDPSGSYVSRELLEISQSLETSGGDVPPTVFVNRPYNSESESCQGPLLVARADREDCRRTRRTPGKEFCAKQRRAAKRLSSDGSPVNA
jgi:hypothetical protein